MKNCIRRFAALQLIVVLSMALGGAHGSPGAADATGDGKTARGPYDALLASFGKYTDPTDSLGFPMKVRSVAADRYKFWRGTKDLFFAWSRDHARDWLDDREAYVVSHGDLHLGNIGTYAAAGRLGEMGFGMVDFDESARLPFQLELLQGVITLRLVAHANRIPLTTEGSAALTDELLASYRGALTAQHNAGELLRDNSFVAKLRARAAKRSYADELDHFTTGGHFRDDVRNDRGELKEILTRQPPESFDGFARGIAQALRAGVLNDEPAGAAPFRAGDEASICAAVVDVARRTRLGSSGSQGLRKYLVLLRRPLVDVDHDVIVYLKQEIPAAAERAGAVPPVGDARSPGERCAADAAALTEPRPFFNRWCEVAGASYWVTLKEPWSEELDAADVKDAADLRHAAHVWGVVAGAAHGRQGATAKVLARLDEPLRVALDERASAYIAKLTSDFASFRADPRVVAAEAQSPGR